MIFALPANMKILQCSTAMSTQKVYVGGKFNDVGILLYPKSVGFCHYCMCKAVKPRYLTIKHTNRWKFAIKHILYLYTNGIGTLHFCDQYAIVRWTMFMIFFFRSYLAVPPHRRRNAKTTKSKSQQTINIVLIFVYQYLPSVIACCCITQHYTI